MRRLLLACLVAAIAVAGTAEAKRTAKPRAVPPKSCAAANAAARRAGKHRAAKRASSRRTARLVCVRFNRGRVTAAERFLPLSSTAPAVSPVTGAATGDSAPVSPPTPTPTPTSTPSGPVLPTIPTSPYAVQVQGFEFGLTLSKPTVSEGNVRVEFNLGRAEDPHNLMLVRADGTGPLYTFDEQPSGAVVAKTLALTSGKWKLFCSLPGHEANGMRATLTVAG